MVTSDIRKFPHYIEQLEKDLHIKPPSFEERLKAYNSLLPSCQRLAQKPIKEIVEIEEEIRLLTLRLRELKKKHGLNE